MTDQDIPIIDAQLYLDQGEGWEEECKKVAYSFHKFGILKFKDQRVTFKENSDYLDMLEKYFDSVSKKYYAGETLKDAKPELCY